MATEVAEEQVVERLEIPVKFASRRSSELRLVLVQRRPVFGEGGLRIGQTEGITAEFHNGFYETDDPEIVERLRKHTQLNHEFVEVGAEPDAVPSSEPQIEAILKATAELDALTLEEILQAEQNGHQRPDVLTAAQAAIRRVHGVEPADA